MFLRSFISGFVLLALVGAGHCNAAVNVDRSIGESRIIKIEKLSAADLVVLDSGYETGFRQNMVCNVSRSGALVGELLIVELRPQVASALILNIAPGQTLQSGDVVAVQTVSTRNH